jgi:ribosomal protein S9
VILKDSLIALGLAKVDRQLDVKKQLRTKGYLTQDARVKNVENMV